MRSAKLLLVLACLLGLLGVDTIQVIAVPIEERIKSGQLSTADLILPTHPRLWLKGEWDWNPNNYGSFAWRTHVYRRSQ